jgi:signal peptidase I
MGSTRRKWLFVGAIAGALVVVGSIFAARLALVANEFVADSKYVAVPSASMVPTLIVGSVHRADLGAYKAATPSPGDIVVFHPPKIASPPGHGDFLWISRCVGTPGDVVEIRSSRLFRNGQPVAEPYVQHKSPADFKLVRLKDRLVPLLIDGNQVNVFPHPFNIADAEEMALKLPPAPIPKGHILTMSDNRTGAFDGRYWGLLETKQVIGRIEDPGKVKD